MAEESGVEGTPDVCRADGKRANLTLPGLLNHFPDVILMREAGS